MFFIGQRLLVDTVECRKLTCVSRGDFARGWVSDGIAQGEVAQAVSLLAFGPVVYSGRLPYMGRNKNVVWVLL